MSTVVVCSLSLPVLVFVCLLFSFLSRPLSLLLGRMSLCLSLSLSLFRCSPCCRLAWTLTCSDHVQLGPPVDLCVREWSPPLSMVFGGCGVPGENLLPCTPRPLSMWFGLCSVQLSRLSVGYAPVGWVRACRMGTRLSGWLLSVRVALRGVCVRVFLLLFFFLCA